MRPLSRKTTREATSRAKPISWVATIIVMPDFANVLHHLQDLADQLRVEGGGGLVEQHHRGLHRQGAGDGDPLLLSARKLDGQGVGLRFELDLRQQSPPLALDLRRCSVPGPLRGARVTLPRAVR